MTPSINMQSFDHLGLAPALLKALSAEGYETPTPIQAKAIPLVLSGRDVVGAAQTGTGKTAAFALPILQLLTAENIRPQPFSTRCLVLSPTRELASQIEASFRAYGRFMKLASTVVFGGVPIGRQRQALRNGVDILVATPGRLLDLVDQNALKLDKVSILVLDEADQMLDLGFIHALRRISKLVPKQRQSLFFSATMPPPIRELAAQYLRDPAEVAVTPVASTAERVTQQVVHTSPSLKPAQLAAILKRPEFSKVIVFTRTKHGADRVVRQLEANGVGAAAIHGNKSQNHRERALAGFKNGSCGVLVATDIAARGIDVDAVSHVVNFDLPNIPESYVHRIGRTARAGADGLAISFCTGEERPFLRSIERLTRKSLTPVEIEVDPSFVATAAPDRREERIDGRRPGGHGRPHNQGQPARNGGGRRFGGAPAGGRGEGGARPAGEARPGARPASPGAGRRQFSR